MRRSALALILVLAACPSRGHRGAPAPPPLESYFPLAAASDREVCAALRERAAQVGDTFRDPEPRRRRKLVISDLHLGPGTAATGRLAGLEDFVADRQLARFLAAHSRTPTDLIIDGDFIDLWQIEGALEPDAEPADAPGESLRLGATRDTSVAAVDVAIAAHPAVFEALARFVARGDNRIIFVAGNHDAGLVWPRVELQLARALRLHDLERVVFVPAPAYFHGGVHVEHGHRFDGSNAELVTAEPVAAGPAGHCRLQSSWGRVFVASYFNRLERDYPFVDNLYPESAAMVWGLGAEPDETRSLTAVVRFVDHLFSRQSGALNAAALRGALLGALGSPFDAGDDSSLLGALWDALPTADRAWAALARLYADPALAGLRDQLVAAARAFPDPGGVFLALRNIDLGELRNLGDTLLGDPMEAAAAALATGDPAVRIVVLAHIHHPTGQVAHLDSVEYANTGSWTPIAPVAALKAAGVAWTQLSIRDRKQFPAHYPAVVIEYRGGKPMPPRLIHAP